MIICCNTKHVSTQLWHHINESTAMGSVSYNVIKLTDNSGNLNHLGKCVSSGLLIFRGKKSKISRKNRPISREKKSKFAEKSADFAAFQRKKSKISKDFQGQIHRKFGRFHGKFRQETISKKQPISLFFWGANFAKNDQFCVDMTSVV